MSSGFVSAGTNEAPIERDDAWLKAQQELEEERRRKVEASQQEGGKSLFEVLQQNKSERSPALQPTGARLHTLRVRPGPGQVSMWTARWLRGVTVFRAVAKQEQFEEKMRLKNQFRALDEDEVDFLDSVLESTRAQEEAVKRDTADQLEAFRKQREEAEKALLGPTSSEVTPAEEEEWAIHARKRRREKGKDLLHPGKKRKASVTGESGKSAGATKEHEARKMSQRGGPATAQTDTEATKPTADSADIDTSRRTTAANAAMGPSKSRATSSRTAKITADTTQAAKPAPVSLGLVGYGSESDSASE
ncbi:uncharacterized protein N7482_007451 [Penicillium canariense]|uniref:FAM192A/Fyv6 N-terminal domain-containing protein n=1 Tax=Penicillium canariense TaxID=189055 RepID=A0A9W9HWS7_9EURO|nr:uncharacterized protein N7482_007451 [Penicillium canariense]KAJ5160447.1 hypothetical protein N7482_007451 [Penicillium canariense]